VWFVVGMLLNVVAFAICTLGQTWIAVPIYLISLAFFFFGGRIRWKIRWKERRKKKEENQAEKRRELTPEEIKKRQISSPEI
jgi:pilus assembly protein TadC